MFGPRAIDSLIKSLQPAYGDFELQPERHPRASKNKPIREKSAFWPLPFFCLAAIDSTRRFFRAVYVRFPSSTRTVPSPYPVNRQ